MSFWFRQRQRWGFRSRSPTSSGEELHQRRIIHNDNDDTVLPLTNNDVAMNNSNSDDDEGEHDFVLIDFGEQEERQRWRRRRRQRRRNERISRELLVLATNHLLGLVICFYILYAICKFGFGWDPTDKHNKPPTTYTIHIPGIT